MKKLLAKDPKMRISASEALNHEWFMTGGEFLSPKTQAPIYLSSAQENMKKFQEQNRFNVKNIKPKDLDKQGLERSLHAPSPLITGKLLSMADSRNQLLNSPDVRLGPGVAAKKTSKFGTQTPSAIEESSDDVDIISDEKNLINQNIKQYQNGVAFNNFIMRKEPTSNSSFIGNVPLGFNKKPQQTHETKVPPKKAINVQNNLLDFLKKNTAEPTIQFTLSNIDKKVSAIKNNLKDMEKIPTSSPSNNQNNKIDYGNNNNFDDIIKASPRNTKN